MTAEENLPGAFHAAVDETEHVDRPSFAIDVFGLLPRTLPVRAELCSSPTRRGGQCCSRAACGHRATRTRSRLTGAGLLQKLRIGHLRRGATHPREAVTIDDLLVLERPYGIKCYAVTRW